MFSQSGFDTTIRGGLRVYVIYEKYQGCFSDISEVRVYNKKNKARRSTWLKLTDDERTELEIEAEQDCNES